MIKDYDYDEGFAFSLTAYYFNGKSGVVITSFRNSFFQNIHLTEREFKLLGNTFAELRSGNVEQGEHHLRKFNESIIAEVKRRSTDQIFYDYVLWINEKNRHTFSERKHSKVFERYDQFTKNQ